MAKLKEIKIESAQCAFYDKVSALRDELDSISDEDLTLFADCIFNDELQSVSSFVEMKASQERDRLIDAKERGCSYDF